MAAVDDVRALAHVDEQEYSDSIILELLQENNDSVEGAAAEIWRRKAASYAELADVQEGSSSRKLSVLYKQALDMAATLDAQNESALFRFRRTMTRPIERA